MLVPRLFVEKRLADRHLADILGLKSRRYFLYVCYDQISVGKMVFNQKAWHHMALLHQENNLAGALLYLPDRQEFLALRRSHLSIHFLTMMPSPRNPN
jgi:hypothetical protein